MKPTILVVDDTPLNLNLLFRLLKDDYHIKVANNGAAALKIAVRALPDLILLDIMMPDMDGYEVCKQLKDNPRTREIPIIFITAKAESSDEVQGLELGAVDYLSKPIVPSILKARVSTHIALRRVRRELEQKNLILNEEKDLLEEIVSRMHAATPFDASSVRLIQKSLEKTCGDIALSAFRPDGAQHVLVGDFSGHGLPAAIAGPLVFYIFYSLTADGRDLSYILAEVNRTLYCYLPIQLYMAASALELSPQRDLAHIWNFGVPPVLCLSDKQEILKIESEGLPLGVCESDGDFTAHTLLETDPSMRIYQYSDGITEIESPEQEAFGQLQLEALLVRMFKEELELEMIWDELSRHSAGSGLTDDAVMLETSVR